MVSHKHTGAKPSAASMMIPNNALARAKRPSITLGKEKKGRNSSYTQQK
jgi:hypothetical protein